MIQNNYLEREVLNVTIILLTSDLKLIPFMHSHTERQRRESYRYYSVLFFSYTSSCVSFDLFLSSYRGVLASNFIIVFFFEFIGSDFLWLWIS